MLLCFFNIDSVGAKGYGTQVII